MKIILGLLICAFLFLVALALSVRFGDEYIITGTIEKVEVARLEGTPVYIEKWEDKPLAVYLTDGTYIILPKGMSIDKYNDNYSFTMRPEKTFLWTYDRCIDAKPNGGK